MPGNAMDDVVHARVAPPELILIFGICSFNLASKSSRKQIIDAMFSFVSHADAASAATPNPAIAGTFSVPPLLLRSCGPPSTSGVTITPRFV